MAAAEATFFVYPKNRNGGTILPVTRLPVGCTVPRTPSVAAMPLSSQRSTPAVVCCTIHQFHAQFATYHRDLLLLWSRPLPAVQSDGRRSTVDILCRGIRMMTINKIHVIPPPTFVSTRLPRSQEEFIKRNLGCCLSRSAAEYCLVLTFPTAGNWRVLYAPSEFLWVPRYCPAVAYIQKLT